ncbi:MAG: hypothetical protein IJ313_05155 [Clostridia bacterium]|nr:hypothetical protein [Clostridia bacterium]
MKKAIALLACVALLLAATFAGVKLYEDRQVLHAAREKLYMEWDKYLSLRNELDGIQLWTMEYVEEYLAQRDWDSLVRARAAVAAGREALKKVEVPKMELDKEAKAALDTHIEELTLVTENLTAAALELQTMRSFFEEMAYSLQYFFLYQTEIAKLEATVKYYQDDLILSEAFVSNATNWLYLQWGMQHRWEETQKEYPSFALFCEPWEKDGGKLEARADASLDEREKLYQDNQSRLIYSESILDDMQAAVAGAPQALRKQMKAPEGMPEAFPMPTWTQEARAIYYGQDVEGETKLVSFGGDLQNLPASAYFYYDYVTSEECDNYCAYLEYMGFSCYEQPYEDGTRLIMVMKGDYVLAVQWTPYETIVMLSDPMASLVSVLDYELLMQ